MKCQACAYVYEKKTKYYEEAVFFKQGKRKGEFKEVVEREITIEVGDRPFSEVTIQGGIQVFEERYSPIYNYGPNRNVDVYACPECGTLKIEKF